jgi:hypothetical protein
MPASAAVAAAVFPAAQFGGNSRRHSARTRHVSATSVTGPAPAGLPLLPKGAKPKMPTFYSPHDFSFIMLHDWRAGPISLVSTRQTNRDADELKRYRMEISMTENSNQRSARIYQFPVGARAATGARHEEPKVRDVLAERLNTALCSGGWYHEAAIQEAQQPAHER